MLGVIGSFTLLCGVFLYSRIFKNYEVRTLLRWAILINFIGALFGLMLALRINVYLGINDLAFVIFSSAITDTLGLAFSQLPSLVLFAKITPKYIEATVYALLTGVFNMSNFFLSPMIGVLINRLFVNVTTSNLDQFYILLLIQMAFIPLPLLLLRLIPLKKEIKEFQKIDWM